jgi:membrane-bound serine protease (ClpP class)
MWARDRGLIRRRYASRRCREAGPTRGRWKAAACLGLLVSLLLALAAAAAPPKIYLLDLKGAVSPVSADFLVRGLHRAGMEGAAVIVLRMDTPGGLDSSMREIIQAILSSPVPVACYVAPSGARAASAGTYILYACHIAAMAPGTNVGAATPVSLFGGTSPPAPEPGKAGSEGAGKAKQIRPPNAELTKITNDAVAYIRSLAKLHGRNADWAERAVREAVSVPYDEALRLNIIDLVADDLPQLLAKLNGRTVKVLGRTRTLELAGAKVVPIKPDFRTRLLAVIADPNVAFILLLIGAYGLIFEFSHPGIFAPGVIGSICLLLGLLALSILPIDLAGLGLFLLGIGLMVAEAFVPSFGALGIGGAIAFVLGALLTFNTPGYRLAWPVLAGATVVSVGLFLLVLAMLVRAHRCAPTSGDAPLLGANAEVIAWAGGEGEVQALGERWHARAEGALLAGQKVRVVGRDGLTLRVEPR